MDCLPLHPSELQRSKLPSFEDDLQEPELREAERRRRYVDAVLARSAATRRDRLAQLRQRRDGLQDARVALLEVAGGEDRPVRLRQGMLRLDVEREPREVDPALAPQRAAMQPGALATAIAAEVETRPVLGRLVHRHSRALPTYLTFILEAHATTSPGHRPQAQREIAKPSSALPGPPWARLLGDGGLPPDQRRRRFRDVLVALYRQKLVALPASGWGRHDRFQLLCEDRATATYTVPGERQTLEVPTAFFLSGWHLVLTPKEIATWLMLRDLARRHRREHENVGVAAPRRVRYGLYGLTDEVYVTHRELTEFGIVRLADLDKRRRAGRRRPDVDDPYQPLRFQLVDTRLYEPALQVVPAALLRSQVAPHLLS